ncbi:hypothetical protein [Streptomyces sp. ST1020]|uniref:hypothetical protein n=1 Tax=Streptomyces sp. ST1020 TaxID=1848901 RepID=UPI0034C66AF8
MQEMQARMVQEMSGRLDAGDCGLGPDRLLLLRWAELVRVTEGGALPADLDRRVPRADDGPLPAVFRVADGRPVAQVAPGRRRAGEGQGAGRLRRRGRLGRTR